MSIKEQNVVMRRFRSNKINLLIATSVAEEGCVGASESRNNRIHALLAALRLIVDVHITSDTQHPYSPPLYYRIDIKECNCVVLFDGLHTSKQYVQSRGRARHAESQFWVFASSEEEAELMEATEPGEPNETQSQTDIEMCKLVQVHKWQN